MQTKKIGLFYLSDGLSGRTVGKGRLFDERLDAVLLDLLEDGEAADGDAEICGGGCYCSGALVDGIRRSDAGRAVL